MGQQGFPAAWCNRPFAKPRSVFLSRQSTDLKVQKRAGLSRLEEDKAEDVISIDLKGKTPIADHMVVASGRSTRHVSAVADHLLRRLKEAGFGTAQVEGMKQADWVLIDGGDVVVHIFRPEVRDFYKLEKMWSADIPADPLAV